MAVWRCPHCATPQAGGVPVLGLPPLHHLLRDLSPLPAGGHRWARAVRARSRRSGAHRHRDAALLGRGAASAAWSRRPGGALDGLGRPMRDVAGATGGGPRTFVPVEALRRVPAAGRSPGGARAGDPASSRRAGHPQPTGERSMPSALPEDAGARGATARSPAAGGCGATRSPGRSASRPPRSGDDAPGPRAGRTRSPRPGRSPSRPVEPFAGGPQPRGSGRR